MRELIALLFSICFLAIAFFFLYAKFIDGKLFFGLILIAVVGGIAIAYGDRMTKFKVAGAEIELAKKEITQVKESAISDLKKEITEQRLLVTSLITTAKELQNKIEEQRKNVEELNKISEKTKSDIEKLNEASEDLALLQVRITYLSMETRNEFGTNRANTALQNISADLNRVLDKVIPDRQERNAWIQKMQNSLPSRGN